VQQSWDSALNLRSRRAASALTVLVLDGIVDGILDRPSQSAACDHPA